MRVLLTGSSGWLGRFLAPRLRAAGHVVIGLDVAPGADTNIVGSVADRAVIERAFREPRIEAVVHTAALHKPDIARYPPMAFIETNVTGTLNLLQAAIAAGHDRFVYTSTTSLMISQNIHQQAGPAAIWVDESLGPLAPRNIYGVTKLAAEGPCRLNFLEHSAAPAGFFLKRTTPYGRYLAPIYKANEFLNRPLTVEDAADAHVVALDRAPAVGFEIFVLSAPTPFIRSDAEALKRAAVKVIERHFPDAPVVYARLGWRLPTSIGRVYDASRIERVLGFRCATDFGRVLDALRTSSRLPYAHEPGYQSPKDRDLRSPNYRVSIIMRRTFIPRSWHEDQQ